MESWFVGVRDAAMKLYRWCVAKFRLYVVFSKPIFFLSGLIFSYALVEKSLFRILITHIGDEWSYWDMTKAAIIVNIHEGTYQLLEILMVYIADAYSGKFKMLVCSTTLHIIGLVLSFIASHHGEDRYLNFNVYYSALVALTLSQAAISVTSDAFLEDQVLARDKPTTEEEEERAYNRSKFWIYALSFLAAIVSYFWVSTIDSSLKSLSKVSAIAIAVGFVLFLMGIRSYKRNKPSGCALSDVVFVIYRAITKRNVKYPDTPDQLFQNSTDHVQILPHVSWLRWLDRAAVMVQDEGKPAAEAQNNNNKTCSVEQVMGVKFLFKMLPIWTTFITFDSLVATGSTFFLSEGININPDFPIVYFVIMLRFIEILVAEISNYSLKKLCEKKKNIPVQMVTLIRIGVGMLCGVLCCVVARVNTMKRNGGFYMLTPQFVLLGFMSGLSEDGLQYFFQSQVPERISKYGPVLGECVMGFGNFLSASLIVVFRDWPFFWLSYDVDSSHLQKYYAFLSILNSASLIIYCLHAYNWYANYRFPKKHQAQAQQRNNLNPGTQDQTASSSTNVLPDNISRNPDIISSSTGQVSSERPSTRSLFPHPSYKRIYRRISVLR